MPNKGGLSGIHPEIALEPIDIHNRHVPKDAATGVADGISTYACGVGRAT